MRLPRSTFYDTAAIPLDAEALLSRIGAICDEFEWYGYRRVGAALRHEGVVVNGKKLRRLTREHGLQPRRQRRFVVTTDGDHGGPIFPDLTKDLVPDRPNQLWVADLTYVAIPGCFVYLAAVLDAWSRKVVDYAISRSRDARIAVVAKAAIRNRAPPEGCVHHSDRGSQYASEPYRKLLAPHKLAGSMRRRGNPCDNTKAESFIKALKVEAVYLTAYERSRTSQPTFRDSSTTSTTHDGCTPPWAISAPCSSRLNTPSRWSKPRPDPVHRQGHTPDRLQNWLGLNLGAVQIGLRSPNSRRAPHARHVIAGGIACRPSD